MAGADLRVCTYCASGRENLCDDPLFTGFTRDGGFATHCVADARYAFAIPDAFGDVEAAPLLCAGLIGYRSLKLAGEEAQALGVYGFGGAAHILAQVAVWQGRRVHAFTRPGDAAAQAFALSLGCASAQDAGRRRPSRSTRRSSSRRWERWCPRRCGGCARAAAWSAAAST